MRSVPPITIGAFPSDKTSLTLLVTAMDTAMATAAAVAALEEAVVVVSAAVVTA